MGFSLSKTLGLAKHERWLKRQTRGGLSASFDYYKDNPLKLLTDYALPIAGLATGASLLAPGKIGGTLGQVGKWGAGRLGLNPTAASSVASGAAGPSGGVLMTAAHPGSTASTLGGIGDWLSKNVSTEKAAKFLGTPTGRMLLTNYVMPQLFPNPDTGNIQQMINQANTARASSLAAINRIGMGPGVASGGAASSLLASQAGRGGAGNTGTMAYANSVGVQQGINRANEGMQYRQLDATANTENNFLVQLERIYGMSSGSNKEYYNRLGTLAQGIAEMFA
jgi:hypothetical protein